MKRGKSGIAQAESYRELGEFWDTHSLADYWAQTEPAEFEVNLQSQADYFPLDRNLSARVFELARRRGISPETLLNLWIQEMLDAAEKRAA